MEFLFKLPTKIEFKNEYIGKVIDISNPQFELPFKNADYFILYKNGIEMNINEYEIMSNEFNRDIIKLTSNINLGDLITCDFKGELFVKCEFDNNSLGVELLQAGLSNINELKLIEVLN